MSLVKFDQKKFLDEHNKLRAKHGVKPLEYSCELNEMAQKYAIYLAGMNNLVHSDSKFNDESVGENLAYWGGNANDGLQALQMWYEENKIYNYNSDDFQPQAGHFSQLVWKGSKYIGLGLALNDQGSYYAVANYYPAGNMIGQFRQNVFPSSGMSPPKPPSNCKFISKL